MTDAPHALEPNDEAAPEAAEPATAEQAATEPAAAEAVAVAEVATTAPEPVRPRRRRRLLVVAAALAVVLAAAGAVVGWRLLTPDPRDVAKDYFARLSAGDATGALRDIDKSSIGADLPTADALLTDAALRDTAWRPQAMTITHVVQAGDTATLTTRYQVNGSTVTQTLKAQRQGRAFALESPLVRLSFANLTPADKARVSVNGVTVDPAKEGPAFPGAYAVVVKGNALLAGRSATAVPSPDAAATVTLPPPSMSAEGRTKTDAAIAAALQQCAAQNFELGSSCPSQFSPFRVGDPDGFNGGLLIEADGPIDPTTFTKATFHVAVTITRQPVCTYTLDADTVTFSCANGATHWDVTLTSAHGPPLGSRSSDSPLQAQGKAALDATGKLQVTFS